VVDGIVYAVEFSPRSIRELVQNCTDRSNVVPILEDANQPQRFSKFVSGEIDVVYQDVAHPNQTEILLKNAKYYLKNGGHVIFCIKARSIDSTEKPSVIFNEQKDILKENGFNILDNVSIHRFQTDHRVIFAQK